MLMTKHSIDPNNEIIGLFLDDNELFVVSTRRIFRMQMAGKDQLKK